MASVAVTPEFEKWAKGFSGCDGGNPKGSIWLCGIEWGTGAAHDLEAELKESVSVPPQSYKTAQDALRSQNGRTYPFNRMFLKLMSAMRYGSVEKWEAIANETPFPFHRESDYFKLNLFPVAFQRIDQAIWDEEYRQLTGLGTRREYVAWCRTNRFPEIRSWVERFRPRLIVGVGLSEVESFKDAFGIQAPERNESIEGRRLVHVGENDTLLAVVPFRTSPSGLNNNMAIQAFGKRPSELLRE